MSKSIWLLPLLSALVSCSPGDDGSGTGTGGGGFCVTVTGGGTNTSSIATSCTSCDIDDRDQSIDDNLNTAAVMHVGSGSTGELALRANAQGMFPAGTTAGFVIDGADNSEVPFVRTLLDGVDQEDSQLTQLTESSDGQTRVYFTTSAQFDSIEAVLPGDAAPLGTGPERSMSVFEFCVN